MTKDFEFGLRQHAEIAARRSSALSTKPIFRVGMVLGEIFEAGTFVVVPEQVYIVKKQQKHGVEWIVSDATGNLCFECKARRIFVHLLKRSLRVSGKSAASPCSHPAH
jgi:hypothetical protein